MDSGLKALLARKSSQKVQNYGKGDGILSGTPRGRKVAPLNATNDQGDTQQPESIPRSRLGKAFADIVAYTAAAKRNRQVESLPHSATPALSVDVDNLNGESSTTDLRIILSSTGSSSSQGSCHEDFDSLGDVFLWGEGTGDGMLAVAGTTDAHLPKRLKSTMVLDAYGLACGSRHAALITKQRDIFSWGEESGGRLGHGVEADVSHPKLINTLSGMNVEIAACGEYHSCAVTSSGDLYTWGGGTYNSGLLGHGSEVGHSVPKKVGGLLDGIHVSNVSCGTWHTALTTSSGQLFTFGDGTFGALGHGDRNSTRVPRKVDALKGMRTSRVACGVWHTAAVIDGSSFGQLFTWGDGDKGQLGHGNKESRLVPEPIASLADMSFSKVDCGRNLTIALTTSGQVYTMGSTNYGQLGSPEANVNVPTCLNFGDSIVEQIACGSHHVAVLTSKSDVYTWGKGSHGQLGHGDRDDRHTPSLVDFFKERKVNRVACGGNVTAVIYLHKWASSIDNAVCFSCRNPFSLISKHRNCYNCGLVFCKLCSSKKSAKASLAPDTNKPYRVCDNCYNKLQKTTEYGSVAGVQNGSSETMLYKFSELAEKYIGGSQIQRQASRLSSVIYEGRSLLNNPKVDANEGNARKGSIALLKRLNSLSGSTINKYAVSGKASSPLFTTSTPSTSEMVLDTTKQRNENPNQEVIYLRAQVEELTTKSQCLEGELEKKTRHLKEATALAADEAEKCKAANEIIKSLTLKLTDIAERQPESQSPRNTSDPNADDLTHCLNASGMFNVKSSNSTLANGSKKQFNRVVHDQPGVYVTLTP